MNGDSKQCRTGSSLTTVAGLLLAASSLARGADGLPDLTIALGASNVGSGLVVPSAGDGVNVPEVVQGSPARRIAGNGSAYLYVVVDHPSYSKGPVDVYVTVEFLDEALGRLGLEYDRAGGKTGSPTGTSQPAMRYGSRIQVAGGRGSSTCRLCGSATGRTGVRISGSRAAGSPCGGSPSAPDRRPATTLTDRTTSRRCAPGRRAAAGDGADLRQRRQRRPTPRCSRRYRSPASRAMSTGRASSRKREGGTGAAGTSRSPCSRKTA